MKRWKSILYQLEKNKKWSEAIDLLQQQIERTPNDPHPWMYLQFLIMNLIVEEPISPHYNFEFYQELGLQCFGQAYAKFSDDPEYLFFTGITAFMSVWLWNIETDDAQKMLDKASEREPSNLLYQWNYQSKLKLHDPGARKRATEYAHMVRTKHSAVAQTLTSHGLMGIYLLEIMRSWACEVIHGVEHEPCSMCRGLWPWNICHK